MNEIIKTSSQKRSDKILSSVIGHKRWKLTVISDAGYNEKSFRLILCRCDCGNSHIIRLVDRNIIKSCGCLYSETRKAKYVDGRTKDLLHSVWIGMKQRCYNPNANGYQNYGGRGITICNEWQDYSLFKNWSNRTGYKKGLSLERIDVNGNYLDSNCKWATPIEQGRNRRNTVFYVYKGIKKSISEWAEIMVGPSYEKMKCKLWHRISKNKNEYEIFKEYKSIVDNHLFINNQIR